MRRPPPAAFASPVLIGALTILVTIVAVFLAYNADQGLPFVPTRELKVDIGDGAQLVPGNDVREGGFMVGLVTQERPIQLASGQVAAQLILQLTKKYADVPVDSTATISPVSLLGVKFLDLHRGKSTKQIVDGGTLPFTQTSVPVQFEDIFKTFDYKTRIAVQKDLVGFGDALAARGGDTNDTIAALPRLLSSLQPVATYLSDPNTELTRFVDALNQLTGALAPVSQTTVNLFRDAGTTFAALDRSPPALEATIAESPPTLATGTDSLANQHTFLADLTTLGHNLTPAAVSLRQALPQINPAIAEGTRVLRTTPPLDREIQHVMTSLKNLAQAPGTNVALNGLTSTVNMLNPMVRYLGPFQTVCDYWDYWWTYLADDMSARTNYGYAQRVMLQLTDPSGNGVGAQGATAPANGEVPPFGPIFGGTEYLHGQSYGAAIDNSGNADCESGQRGFPKKLNNFDPLGRDLAIDPHTPGDQGPTYHGRTRVPAGETYTREPQTGPQLTPDPKDP